MTGPAPVTGPAPMTSQLTEPAIEGDPQDRGPNHSGPDHSGPNHSGPRQSSLLRLWQRLRVPLALVTLVVVGGVVIALLSPRPKSNVYLDPASKDPTGTEALADILADRGFHVISAYSPQNALSDLGPGLGGSAGKPSAILVVTRPELLTAAQRKQLARVRSDLLLVGPGSAALAALAPAVHLKSGNAPFSHPILPACNLRGAELAGSADVGGITYTSPDGAVGCYPTGGSPSLVRYTAGGRTITILGSGEPLSNGLLATEGNAALGLNLLNGERTIVWLTPEPTIASPPPQTTGRSGPALIPKAAWLVVLQLCVALVLAALWRMRRFGPLITERLPVVVRASETVEGHARLYQSRRARDRAASALRAAMLARTRPVLGLAADTPVGAVVDAIAGRSSLPAADIAAILDGPPPKADADLVKLADDLDKLEREVRAQ